MFKIKEHKIDKKKFKRSERDCHSNESLDFETLSETLSSKSEKRKKQKTDSDKSNHRDSADVNLSETQWSRDSWMTQNQSMKTFTRVKSKNGNEMPSVEAYDPTKSARELNPHWKTTGTGLPSIKKSERDSDFEKYECRSSARKSWRKPVVVDEKTSHPTIEKKDRESDHMNAKSEFMTNDASNDLTDQQMNELAAKILKADIMGNKELAKQLQEKLDHARQMRPKNDNLSKKRSLHTKNSIERHVMTPSDEHRISRPSSKSSVGESVYNKKSNKYIPQDDKYDLKQMFVQEKFLLPKEANLQFANIAAKYENRDDDLGDLFGVETSGAKSKHISGGSQKNEIVQQNDRYMKKLDTCRNCIESKTIDRDLIIFLGKNSHIALPWHVGLQTGHCIITSNQHIGCCTQLDEDTWLEINDIRKTLVRMFASRQKEVIFFETANNLHRNPHLIIHCVPLEKSQAQIAPCYFKKAIEEVEYEWSTNKQLINLQSKGLRRSVPKELPYFWVSLGVDEGFAHVIEDQNKFPKYFAEEILGGIMRLRQDVWRKPQKEHNVVLKVKQFGSWWNKCDYAKSELGSI